MQLREATSNDVIGIANLHAKNWQQNYRGAFSDAFLDNDVVGERLEVWTKRFRTANSNQLVTLADDRGKILGFVCIFLADHEAYGTLLDNLHVASSAQNLGIGTRLMASVAKKCSMVDPDSGIYLWVLQQNKKAIDFYEALGGNFIELVEGIEVGNQKVLKCRYFWPKPSVLYENALQKLKKYER